MLNFPVACTTGMLSTSNGDAAAAAPTEKREVLVSKISTIQKHALYVVNKMHCPAVIGVNTPFHITTETIGVFSGGCNSLIIVHFNVGLNNFAKSNKLPDDVPLPHAVV